MTSSKISLGKLLVVLMKGLQIATISLIVVIVVFFIFLKVSGKSFLDRSAPSKDGYAASYFDCFEGSQVEKVDFVWRGAIGGIMTVGRVQFDGPVKFKAAIVDAKFKAGEYTIGTYDPSKMTESDRHLIQCQLTAVTDREMPPWLDFPFDRKMRTLTELIERGPDPAHPQYPRHTIWYIDDERNVVYMYGCWG